MKGSKVSQWWMAERILNDPRSRQTLCDADRVEGCGYGQAESLGAATESSSGAHTGGGGGAVSSGTRQQTGDGGATANLWLGC